MPWLSEAQWGVLATVADRIVPGDEWPSANEAGALADLAERASGGAVPIATAELALGLSALDDLARSQQGVGFCLLDEESRDALLRELEAGTPADWPVNPAHFFEALLRIVCEGYYARPARGLAGPASPWAMVGFHDRLAELGGSKAEPLGAEYLPSTPPAALAARYDVVVVGAGAGGGAVAALASEAGLSVLVIERGRWLSDADVGRDHLRNQRFSRYGTNAGPGRDERRAVLEASGDERLVSPLEPAFHNNASTVGGGTRVFGAQAWRFHPEDFHMARRYGVPEQSSLADWPIDYDDLEPYYDRVEWELGVAGDGASHQSAGWRRRGYPMPAIEGGAGSARLALGARALGWETGPVPLLINSVPYNGRPACGGCAHCVGFACPTDAKNGAHNTVLRRALATGRADLATGVSALRVAAEREERVDGVEIAWETSEGTIERRFVGAGHVVVAAGAVESARLLLNSASPTAPHGLGNAHDQVGRHLQGHVYTGALGQFTDVVQDCKGPGPGISTRIFNHDLEGAIGGGMLADDFVKMPVAFGALCLPPGAPRWGRAGKQSMQGYARTIHVTGPVEEVPSPESRVRVSRQVRDRFAMPVALFSGGIHPETVRAASALRARAAEWLTAAGAERVWLQPLPSLTAGQHQAGTLRMGDNPAVSATDSLGRVHGYPNLWVADSSVHVTNGGVNPVLTILALAHRTAGNLLREA